MDWLLIILVGAFIGWVSSIIMKTDEEQGAVANIIIGIVGSALGRWFFGEVLNIGGAATAGAFSLIGLVWGVVGAVLLIALLKFFRVMGSPR